MASYFAFGENGKIGNKIFILSCASHAEPPPAGQKTDFWFSKALWFCAEICGKMRAKPRRRRGERANKLSAKSVKFRLVAITERSANLFRATISALTGRNPAQRFRSPDGEQNRKIFLTFFNCAPPKFFSIKETKIFLFRLPADAGIAETLSRPIPPSAESRRAKIPSPRPPSFLPARLARFAGEPPIFRKEKR